MTVLFAADYDLASPGQAWQAVQQPAPGRVTVVAPPGVGAAKPEGNVLRVDLHAGETFDSSGYVAPRCEVYGRTATSQTPAAQWPDPPGSVRWYGWSLLVPDGFTFATDTTWLTCTQWKGLRGGSPPIAIEIKRSGLRLGGARTNAGKIPGDGPLGPITRGTWTRLVVGMKLSAGPDGWVQVFRDGREVWPRTTVPTLDVVNGQPDPVYLKQGIYRDTKWAVDQTLYFGPLLIGERLRDVA